MAGLSAIARFDRAMLWLSAVDNRAVPGKKSLPAQRPKPGCMPQINTSHSATMLADMRRAAGNDCMFAEAVLRNATNRAAARTAHRCNASRRLSSVKAPLANDRPCRRHTQRRGRLSRAQTVVNLGGYTACLLKRLLQHSIGSAVKSANASGILLGFACFTDHCCTLGKLMMYSMLCQYTEGGRAALSKYP